MMNIMDLAITSLETVAGFDIQTGAFKFVMDEMQNVSLSQAEEKVDITGKQGRKLTSLKRNKTLTISGTNGMISGGLQELQTGGEFKDNAKSVVKWMDYLTVNTNAATTTYKAIGGEGNEIAEVYIKDSKTGAVTKVLTQDAEATSGHFTYEPSNKTITFYASEVADGTEIVVCYNRNLKASVLENMSDKYSGKCSLYIDATAEDKCANIYHVQIYIPKADFSGEFSLEMGDNQTVHSFTAEALAGACGTGGSLWTYTVFGAAEADAE